MLTAELLIAEFARTLRVTWAPSDLKLLRATRSLLTALAESPLLPEVERRARLFALINSKFDVNKARLDDLYGHCARMGVTFNYHEKIRLADAYDRHDIDLFRSIVEDTDSNFNALEPFFCPADFDETLSKLHQELRSPTLVRKDSKPRDRSPEILQALFGGYVFSIYRVEHVHGYFDADVIGQYEPDFWKYLHLRHKGGFSRSKTLTYIRLDGDRDLEQLCSAARLEYDSLSNHGHLAVHLSGWDSSAWRSSAYLTLFAEKFREESPSGAFFRAKEIEQRTRAYIPLDDDEDYQFQLANVGFHYKDTFVFANGRVTDILLIFQKHEPDETLIVCPACRSHEVRGNSYSSLGVKSWECQNPLCPERSKFNRGKRYSFYQLLKQQAIEVSENQIPRALVRSWARDVQPSSRSEGIVAMLLQHYSLAGDGVLLVNAPLAAPLGRNLIRSNERDYFASASESSHLNKFLRSSYFGRFCVDSPVEPSLSMQATEIDRVLALHGNSTGAMGGLAPSSLDGAVTSPPYYNAREYSQWDNIYCFLYDMFSNIKMAFRLLKPGGFYLFNIFDYFDNENSITLSAMGQKRMILSAYTIQLFERAGFNCVGNVVWDKGDIEGKRAFNGGNYSPYYQAPFNCWEHILVFRKPGNEVRLSEPLPDLIRLSPVIKMVGGENRHGHTAPFPEQLPRLLLDRLPTTATVLDPFAGSMTTGVAALKTGHGAICIELDRTYFELGLSRLAAAAEQRVPI